MQNVSYQEAGDDFAALFEAARRDHRPITITRDGTDAVVLLSSEEFAAMEETLHLLSTPANAERIRAGLSDYAAGKFQPGELCD